MNDLLLHYDEFNLYCLFKALVRNLWVILLLCASTILCYSAYSKLTYGPATPPPLPLWSVLRTAAVPTTL